MARLQPDLSLPSLRGLIAAIDAAREGLSPLPEPLPLLQALALEAEQALKDKEVPADLQAHADRERARGRDLIAAGQAVCAAAEVMEAVAQRENNPTWARRNVGDAAHFLAAIETTHPHLGQAVRAAYDEKRQALSG